VYGRGGGRDLEEAGALFAGDLAGPKVRVLLQVALGGGLDAAAALAAEAC
jgi:L-asparaginase